MKKHLALADVQAFNRAKSLRWGQEVKIDGNRAFYSGVLEDSICFRIKGRNTFIPVGDRRLREMEV